MYTNVKLDVKRYQERQKRETTPRGPPQSTPPLKQIMTFAQLESSHGKSPPLTPLATNNTPFFPSASPVSQRLRHAILKPHEAPPALRTTPPPQTTPSLLRGKATPSFVPKPSPSLMRKATPTSTPSTAPSTSTKMTLQFSRITYTPDPSLPLTTSSLHNKATPPSLLSRGTPSSLSQGIQPSSTSVALSKSARRERLDRNRHLLRKTHTTGLPSMDSTQLTLYTPPPSASTTSPIRSRLTKLQQGSLLGKGFSSRAVPLKAGTMSVSAPLGAARVNPHCKKTAPTRVAAPAKQDKASDTLPAAAPSTTTTTTPTRRMSPPPPPPSYQLAVYLSRDQVGSKIRDEGSRKITSQPSSESTTKTRSLVVVVPVATSLSISSSSSPMSMGRRSAPRSQSNLANLFSTTTRPCHSPPRKPLVPLAGRSPAGSLSTTPPPPPLSSEKIVDVDTRRNLDKRSARLRYSHDFGATIAMLKTEAAQQQPHNEGVGLPSPSIVGFDATVAEESSNNNNNKNVAVYIRKRPIFAHELEEGDFDVVVVAINKNKECGAVNVANASRSVTLYNAKMHADMQQKLLQPVYFGCTAAFDEYSTNDHVYDIVALPLLESALIGKKSTLLMFGQTGSGKTYTMNALQQRLARTLFASNKHRAGITGVTAQCVELAGATCRDLLSNAVVRLVDRGGGVEFLNAAVCRPGSAKELLTVFGNAQACRATHGTDKNEESSRSHAVCRIVIERRNGKVPGVLTLVDCAGTERRNDSLYHSKSRQVESAEINASLYALKECIRARGNQEHVPYRSNILTRVLREGLEDPQSPLAVMATVAPTATDYEHSYQTLASVSALLGQSAIPGALQKVRSSCNSLAAPKPPKGWTHQELVQWMKDKRIQVANPVSEQLDGRTVMRMSKLQLRNALFLDSEMGKADIFFQRLRAETDRVARLDLKRRIASKS